MHVIYQSDLRGRGGRRGKSKPNRREKKRLDREGGKLGWGDADSIEETGQLDGERADLRGEPIDERERRTPCRWMGRGKSSKDGKTACMTGSHWGLCCYIPNYGCHHGHYPWPSTRKKGTTRWIQIQDNGGKGRHHPGLDWQSSIHMAWI